MMTVTVMMIFKYYYITLNKGVSFLSFGDTKGTFHAKMGAIKYRNSMDLTEAKDIETRWEEYTELVHKSS